MTGASSAHLTHAATERRLHSESDKDGPMTDVARASLSRRAFVLRCGAIAASISVVPLLQACTATAPPAATSAPAAPPPPTTAPAAAAATAAPKPSAVVAAQGTPGGTLRVTLGAEPTTMDPAKSSTLFDADVHDALFDGLFSNDIYDPITGTLAESWDTPDGKTWTIKLKKGLKFHDGQDVTSAAVKFTVDRLLDPATGASPQPKGRALQIASMSTPDPSTVVFDLKAPSATWPLELSDILIVPPNFDATKPVGTGPFMFVEWVRNQRVRVKKHPNYHMAGLPYLDEVVFLPTPDENQKIVLLQTGQVDFTDTIPLPRVKELTAGGAINVVGIEPGVSPSSYFMLVRTDKKPFDDPRVRQAMNYAIDRKSQLDVTFNVGTIKSNPVPPKSWAFSAAAPSYNDRDIAKAKSLLAAAGYPNGFPASLKHITSRAEFAPMAQLFQASMADVGIKIDVVPLEIGVWIEQAQNQYDYEIALTGVIPGPDPDAIMTSLYDQNQANGKMTFYKNDQLQQLIQQGRAAVDREQRKQIYAQAQTIIMTDLPAWPINERPILFGASPAVQGFKADVRQHFHFHRTWLKK
jgi:peptide/nickel transport system substrate-binding protein